MNGKELDAILKEGEGYKIEFKEGFNNLDKEMVAFANSSGGRIFLGVTDAGEVKGIGVSNGLKSRIQDIANNCRPSLVISIDSFDDILIINIEEGVDKPYECSYGFYKRIGANSQKISRDEILELFKSEGKVRFDELIQPKFSYPDDFDDAKLTRFLELAGISKSVNREKLLINLGVAEKKDGILNFNNAGVLFFAKEPQSFIPWSVFTVALFKDYGGADVIDRKDIEGSLFDIVEDVMKFVRLYSKVAYRFTGMPQRENVYEYPFEAIREAVINSVMHKYYFEHGHSNILKFFPDRIRIENYWQEPPNFILGESVFRRNNIIADLFGRIHFGEKMGTGLERINEICKKDNAPVPDIEFNENYFYVNFRQSEEYLKLAKGDTTQETTQKATQKATQKTTQKILFVMRENPSVTRDELARLVGITPDGVKYHLDNLKKKGIIRRVGGRKEGYWEVLGEVGGGGRN